ncbi:hypothetical protein SETIT_4G044300v2 [Setaria italica]|uniref:Uncharacterized protein n=1 Tax=Setaria italica TaxID=4555 RepID=A0A368QQN7_SETIT|nr:hypothetical protein SETIT_4G044300v2 [Setaria italica]
MPIHGLLFLCQLSQYNTQRVLGHRQHGAEPICTCYKQHHFLDMLTSRAWSFFNSSKRIQFSLPSRCPEDLSIQGTPFCKPLPSITELPLDAKGKAVCMTSRLQALQPLYPQHQLPPRRPKLRKRTLSANKKKQQHLKSWSTQMLDIAQGSKR